MTNKQRLFNTKAKSADQYTFFQKIPAFFRMLKAWKNGEYKPKRRNIIISVLALIYVISPLDFIPEALFAVFGLVDDLAIAGFAFTRIMKEVDRFIDWEGKLPSGNIIDTDAQVVK